jgi:hypothetical protein
MARVQVLRETTLDPQSSEYWTIWFQWCRYLYDDGNNEYGYRFIWRRPENTGGALQAARGQARIPSIDVFERLVAQAKQEGWGERNGDRVGADNEAAAARLRARGLIVDVASGYVGWPTHEAAEAGHLTEGMIQDTKIVTGSSDQPLPVSGRLQRIG